MTTVLPRYATVPGQQLPGPDGARAVAYDARDAGICLRRYRVWLSRAAQARPVG